MEKIPGFMAVASLVPSSARDSQCRDAYLDNRLPCSHTDRKHSTDSGLHLYSFCCQLKGMGTVASWVRC